MASPLTRKEILRPATSTMAGGGGSLVLAALLMAPAVAKEPPALVALVLDTSGSIPRSELPHMRELVLGVLTSLPAGSEVAVFSFADQALLVQPRTSDPEAVRRAVDGLRISGQYTALYDALYDASRYLQDAGGGQRAILLITDGKDENSALNLEDGLRLAQETRIPVFCVGVGRVEERILRRIGKLTGGDYLAAPPFPGSALGKVWPPRYNQSLASHGRSSQSSDPAHAHRWLRMPRPKFRNNAPLVLLLTAGALALFLTIEVLLRKSRDFSPDFLASVLLYGLTVLNLTLLLILIFVLGRNLVRVVLDRRRGVLGARFRMRLLLVFLLMAIAPSLLLIVVGSDLIQQTVDRWFNVDVERILSSSQALGTALRE
ncbi:MAG TPA: VWA domain-containing protein, partial [Vicinamibacteria bacterium]|nr:VWA domain-containing protein [Vicinamibacteria bacterium]